MIESCGFLLEGCAFVVVLGASANVSIDAVTSNVNSPIAVIYP